MIASTDCKAEIGSTAPCDLDAAESQTEPRPNRAEICPSTRSSPRILLTEDHADTGQVIKRFLERAGLEVILATDLKTALETIERQTFDVIISDIALPDGTGYALISEARRRGIRALAIALSAYRYPTEVFKPEVTGFDHHLRKPFDPAMLRLILELEGYLQRTPPPQPI